MEHPWELADYPLIAAGSAANEKPLRLIEIGTRRPRFYLPSGAWIGRQFDLDSFIVSGISALAMRKCAWARATLSLSAGELDAAHADR